MINNGSASVRQSVSVQYINGRRGRALAKQSKFVQGWLAGLVGVMRKL